jgi:hypothetical protein
MHLHPIPLDDWRWQCVCGARAQRKYGQCRKCQARDAWWRRTMRARRGTHARRVYRHGAEAVSE